MREIEVKFRVNDLEALLVSLKDADIVLGNPVYQDDQAYAPIGWNFGDSKLGVSFVRMRTVGGRHYFALKQPGENAQACLEFETEVADRGQMDSAITKMGYRRTVRVAKTRRTATVNGLSLCVDELEGAGYFLELERLVADTVAAGPVQEELAAFAASLGVELMRTAQTYDTLVRETQAPSV
jgi:adenylate cyclase, class 2